MRKVRLAPAQVMPFLAVIALSGQAVAGDADMGREIALEYCSACHDVSPNGAFKLEPPSFAAIAIYRSEDQIRKRIVDPIHDDMPDYSRYMIGGNIDDMVAYIASLEK